MKAQEEYAESLSGKMTGLTSSIAVFWQTFINSEAVGSVIDTFTSLINGATLLVEKFGTLSSTVLAVGSGLTVLNSEFRKLATGLVSNFSPSIGNLNAEFDNLIDKKSKLIELKKIDIDVSKTELVAIDGMIKKVEELGDVDDALVERKQALEASIKENTTSLKVYQNELLITKAKALALQAVTSVGLSLAFTAVATAISKAWEWLKKYSDYAGKAKEISEDFKKASDDFKDVTTGDTAKTIKELEKQVSLSKSIHKTEEEKKEIADEINSLKEKLIGYDDEYSRILNNEKLTLEEQLALIQKITREKAKQNALDLEDKLDEQYSTKGIGTVEHIGDQLEKNKANIAELKELIEEAEATGNSVQWRGQYLSLDNLKEKLKEQEDAYEDHYIKLLEYNEKVSQLQEYGLGADKTEFDLSEYLEGFREIAGVVEEEAKTAEEAVGALTGRISALGSSFKELSSVSDYRKTLTEFSRLLSASMGSVEEQDKILEEFLSAFPQYKGSIKDVSEALSAFGEVTLIEVSKAKNEAEEFLKTLEETKTMSYDTASELLEAYPELAGHISDSAYVQDFLNQKIKEMENTANLAYENMVAYDDAYFESKVKNSDSFNTWKQKVEQSLLIYENNLRNAGLKNEADMFSQKAKNAIADLNNAKNIAQARATLEQNLINGMSSAWEQYYGRTMEQMRADLDHYYANIDKVPEARKEELKNLATQYEMILGTYNGVVEEVSKPIVIAPPTFSSSSNSKLPSSSSSSSSSSTKKEVADLDLVIDRYYELESAMKRVENALSLNKIKQENATATEKVKLMKEEVELLKEKQELTEKYRKELTKEANELKKSLSKNGVLFDSQGNITNYAKLLTQLEKSANKLSGEAKENKINAIEKLVDDIERYTELINSSIPSMTEDWADLTNQIKEAQRAQLEYVTDIQEKITDALKDELQKRTDAVKAELEKQKNLYNEQFEEEDWKDSLTKEQRKLDELKQQISSLSRDTSLAGQLKLEDLMSQYEEQLEVINQMIRDREKEKGNEAFDSAIEDLDQKLENALDPKNLAQMVNQALTQGFIDLGGEVISTENLLTQMLETSGEAFTTLGQTLRKELIDGLQVAKGLASDLGSAINGIGFSNNARSVMSVSSASSQLTSRMVGGLDAVSTVGRQVEQAINLTFKNLLNVEGNLDSTILADVELMLDNAKNEITYSVAKALQTI